MPMQPSQLACTLEDMQQSLGLTSEVTGRLMERFLSGNQTYLPQLEKACETQDFEAIHHHAHTIKGAAATMHFDEMAGMAEKMELAAADRADADYAGMLKGLEAYAQSIAASYAQMQKL